MIYSRLPVLFLGTITSEKYGAGNAAIASTLLNHIDEIKDFGIQEIADFCGVSVSSISRFCNQIGLSGFAEFKEILTSVDFTLERQSQALDQKDRFTEYENNIVSAVHTAIHSVDKEKLSRLIKDIHQYDRVAIFGLLKAQAAAISLASDLAFCGKQVYTNTSFAAQMDHLKAASDKDLILVFSYTGSFFEGNERSLSQRKKHPKIWMISGKDTCPSFVYDVLSFDSKLDQASHPYQLCSVATLIAQEYAYQYK